MENEKCKSKIKPTDESQITGQPIDNVINSKIEFIVELTRQEYPHIYYISKNVIMMGGKMFNSMEDNNPIKIPLRGSWKQTKHLPGRMPTVSEQKRMEKQFGLAWPWPPKGLMGVIQDCLRSFEDELIENDDIVIMAPCRGYIDENGILKDPAWNKQERWSSNQISGYLFYRKDEGGITSVKKYLLEEADQIFQRQVERTKFTAPKLRESRAQAANTMFAKADRRIMRIKSLDNLTTNEHIENWEELKVIKSKNK